MAGRTPRTGARTGARTRVGPTGPTAEALDVDAMHETVVGAGHVPEFTPRDAPWGERYFHLRDPDGHELSFARPLR